MYRAETFRHEKHTQKKTGQLTLLGLFKPFHSRQYTTTEKNLVFVFQE